MTMHWLFLSFVILIIFTHWNVSFFVWNSLCLLTICESKSKHRFDMCTYGHFFRLMLMKKKKSITVIFITVWKTNKVLGLITFWRKQILFAYIDIHSWVQKENIKIVLNSYIYLIREDSIEVGFVQSQHDDHQLTIT
jgi:hypothetical protein